MTVTAALELTVNVQLVVRPPALEQAPDHIALRPLDTRRVTDVPLAKVVAPELPVRTLTPLGVETTVSPLRPVAVTVRVMFEGGGGVVAGVMVAVAVTLVPL